MGIKFGEIDASQVLENEYRIQILERIIEKILIYQWKTKLKNLIHLLFR